MRGRSGRFDLGFDVWSVAGALGWAGWVGFVLGNNDGRGGIIVFGNWYQSS